LSKKSAAYGRGGAAMLLGRIAHRLPASSPALLQRARDRSSSRRSRCSAGRSAANDCGNARQDARLASRPAAITTVVGQRATDIRPANA
jgi:hypothetical protein